jgi:hypothetical protein
MSLELGAIVMVVDFEADKLRCDLGVARGTSLRPAILDHNGATFNPAEFTQSLHKSSSPGAPEASNCRYGGARRGVLAYLSPAP